MIVGVFGDSFAEGVNDLSWTVLLSTTHSLKVQNYAMACTSAFWSFRQLTEHINDVDVVVFEVSSVGRLYHDDIKYRGVCTPLMVQTMLADTSITKVDREVYEAADKYFRYIESSVFNKFVQEQILKEIVHLTKTHGKRLILVPGFNDGVEYQSQFDMALMDITQQELLANFGDTNFRSENVTRANHISKENNVVLAEKIAKLIQDPRLRVNIDDFVFEKYVDPKLYWI